MHNLSRYSVRFGLLVWSLGFGSLASRHVAYAQYAAPSPAAGTNASSTDQNAPAQAGAGPSPGAPAAGAPTQTAPRAGAATTTVVSPWGFPGPGAKPDTHLPSSSRSYTGETEDGFDMGGTSPNGNAVVHGNPGAPGVFQPSRTTTLGAPSSYVVQRGDTLWDITTRYYHTPLLWPKLWSFNPHIQNPHWIYPGDQIRLRKEGEGRALSGAGSANGSPDSSRRFSPLAVAPGVVVLRDEGYIDDERTGQWGVVSGSPEDSMLLTQGNAVYLEIPKGHDIMPGQELTVFRPVRHAPAGTHGEVVQILGTAHVESWDEPKRIAKAKLTESTDVIERGARVGPVTTRFVVVPPVKNAQEVAAHVLVSVYPRVLHGQNQVVFIDRGAAEGLRAGNRLFLVRRGDPWRATLEGSGDLSDKSVRNTAELTVETESVRGTDRDKGYPDEVIGELRVLQTREHTATCLVTSSRKEIIEGDLAVARKGY